MLTTFVFDPPPSFNAGMLGIDRPAIVSNRAVITQCLSRLDVTTVACPTYGLQVIQIKEQLEIAFMRFQVMHHCTAWVICTRLQVSTAAAVLALVCVACQCLSPKCLPMFGAVKRAICLCFYTAKITLQMYTYVFVDYGFFALNLL